MHPLTRSGPWLSRSLGAGAVAAAHGLAMALALGWGGSAPRPAPPNLPAGQPTSRLVMLYAVHAPAQAPVQNPAVPAQAAQPGALPPPAPVESAGLSAAVSRPETHLALVRAEVAPPQHPAAEASSPPAQAPLVASVQATTTLARVEARSPEAAAASGPAGPDRSAQALPGNPLPPYPEAAREDGLEGSVSLAVALDAQGRVTAVQWLRRCGVALLDHAAREAVRQWRFAPALRAGQPVASSLVLNLRFRLDAPQAQATVLASAAPP